MISYKNIISSLAALTYIIEVNSVDDIKKFAKQSGRVILEDGTVINFADVIKAVFDVANGTIKVGATLETTEPIVLTEAVIKNLSTADTLEVNPNGEASVAIADGANVALGSTTDAETVGNGSVISILKKIRSNTLNYVLSAGSAIVGKFGIDQTTDGTTNKVRATQPVRGDLNANATMQINAVDVSEANRVPISIASNSTLIQDNVTLTGIAQQLSNNACKFVEIQANPDNVGYVYIGRSNLVSSSVHMFVLTSGSSHQFDVTNSNLIYVIGTTGDKISFGGEI